MVEELIIGRLAQFNHRAMGLVDVRITMKMPIGNFYAGELRVIHMNDLDTSESALGMNKLIKLGHDVNVFVQVSDLVSYLD